MRRESSTVVVLVGEVNEGLLAELGRSVNVSVARAPAAGAGPPGAQEPTGRPGWEAGALALREASRRQSAAPADALAAWRDKRFELPDYYLVMAAAPPGGTGPDLYLGPLRAARRFYAGGLTEAQPV